jgi:NIPSNAP
VIYEMRTYTFHQGKLPAYLDLARKVGRPVRGQNYGTNHGYWTSEFGSLNQVWHLWSYVSLDERERMRVELSKNERWNKEYVPNVRPLLARQDIRFLNPVYGVNPPAKEGGFYELRMYRTNPGLATGWASSFRDIMNVREKYSRNIGIWTGEAPQPNEVWHMWNYQDTNERTKARSELFKDPEWSNFLSKGAGTIVEMQNTMLIPTDFSGLK